MFTVRGMGKLAALCVALAAIGCIEQPRERAEPRIAVGGDSPIVGALYRVADRSGVPVEVIAAVAQSQTRFRIVDASEHNRTAAGIFALPPDAIAHGAQLAGVSEQAARTEIESGLAAGAMLLREAAAGGDVIAALEPNLQRSVTRILERGVDARDTDGRSIVIAARPHTAGYGHVEQAAGYEGATWYPASTQNYDEASRGVGDITNVVIHTTQGNFDGTIGWFQDPSAQVSAHYVVRSEDGFVAQMVSEKNVAWHDKCFNTHSVGIEHEGFIDAPDVWYTEPMYLESAKLTSYLCDKYGIAKEFGAIVGHDMAPDCSDHVDPGPGWDWNHYLELVKTGGATFAGSDVTVDAPERLVSGERATVTVSITNQGNTAWELDVTRLGTALPQDRESELFADGDWISPSRATSIDARVEPGEVGTFTFDIVAPEVSSPTTFDEGFQLVEEGVIWFGPDIHVDVEVVPAEDHGGCSAGGGAGGAVALLGLTLRRRRRR